MVYPHLTNYSVQNNVNQLQLASFSIWSSGLAINEALAVVGKPLD